MKKIIYLLLSFLVLFSACGEDSKQETKEAKIEVVENQEIGENEVPFEDTITEDLEEDVNIEIGELI